MKIEITRAELLPAIALAVKGIDRSTTIPILNNVKLAVEPSRLILTSTNLNAEIASELACGADGSGAFTLPAAQLHDIVKNLPDGADIALNADERYCAIACGRSKFKLPVLPASDFPNLNAGEFPHSFGIPAPTLKKVLATLDHSVSDEATRFYLNGIYLHLQGKSLIAVATDGHRVARYALPKPEGIGDMPGVIIPRQILGLIRELAGEKGEISIAVSTAKIRVTAERATLTSRLVEGTFPDYQRVIPTGNENIFAVDRVALQAAVNRVCSIRDERTNAVRFAFGNDSVRLSRNSSDLSESADEVPLEKRSGEAVEIGFNGTYCKELLAATEAARLSFELGDVGSPARILPEGDDAALFVLMPTRL